MISAQAIVEREEMQLGNLNKSALCALCLNIISYTNSQVIEEVATEVLEIVLPNLNLEMINEYRLCKPCWPKLFAAYNFKATCMYTEDIIFSHISTDTEPTIELKEVYIKVNENIKLTDTLESQRICRLCLQLVTYGFMSLDEVDSDIIDTYIPQINIHATKNPVVCVSCFNSLATHGSFLRACLKEHEKCKSADSKLYIKSELELEENIEKQFYIKSGEIEIKTEEEEDRDNDTFSCKSDEKIIEMHTSEDIAEPKHEVKCETKDQINKYEAPLNVSSYTNTYKRESEGKCNICDYAAKHKYELKRHQLVHKDASEVTMYKCNDCKYATKRKVSLKRHLLVHKDASEVAMYKCDICNYATKRMDQLKCHQLVHKDASKMKRYKCDMCNYVAKRKEYLDTHQFVHKDASQMTVYKCSICDYAAKKKGNLKRHLLLHKNTSKVTMYKCSFCDYVAKRKDNLKCHLLNHKIASEVTMYKCSICDYANKKRSNFKRHLLVHNDASEVTMYKCDICDYAAKWMDQLKCHQLVHKDASEMKTYKCDMCNYVAKRKEYLDTHQFVHNDASHMTVYKCSICDYATKKKCNLKRHLLLHKDTS